MDLVGLGYLFWTLFFAGPSLVVGGLFSFPLTEHSTETRKIAWRVIGVISVILGVAAFFELLSGMRFPVPILPAA